MKASLAKNQMLIANTKLILDLLFHLITLVIQTERYLNPFLQVSPYLTHTYRSTSFGFFFFFFFWFVGDEMQSIINLSLRHTHRNIQATQQPSNAETSVKEPLLSHAERQLGEWKSHRHVSDKVSLWAEVGSPSGNGFEKGFRVSKM